MCSQLPSITKSKKSFVRERHLNIVSILTFQYLNLIPLVARSNLHWIFIGQTYKQRIDLLISEFISGDISKKVFIKMYNRCSKCYNILVINNNLVKDHDLNSICGVIKPKKIKKHL